MLVEFLKALNPETVKNIGLIFLIGGGVFFILGFMVMWFSVDLQYPNSPDCIFPKLMKKLKT